MTLEEKLEYFSKQIKEKIDNEYDAKLNKTKMDNELRLSQKKDELIKTREKQIRDFIESNETRMKKQISLKKQETNKLLSDLKKEMFKQIRDEVTDELNEFINSDSYHNYLIDLFSFTVSSLPEGNYEVCALEKDSEIVKRIIDENKKNNYTFKFCKSDDNILGGMLFLSLEKGFIIDNSLRFKLDNVDKVIYEYITKKLEVKNGQ